MAVVKVVVEIDYCDRCNSYDPRDLVQQAMNNTFGQWETLSWKVLDGIPAAKRKA